MPVRFEDFTLQVKADLEKTAEEFLCEASQMLAAQAAQLTPVNTGQLRDSWDYRVDTARKGAAVGSPLKNALWNELGTGEYAAGGNGRRGGWSFRDAKGRWHFTKGQRPRRTLQKAFDAKKNSVKERAKLLFEEMGT